MDELPRCMHEKHGSFYLVKGNRWIRLGRNRAMALERYTELTQGFPVRLYKALYARARGRAAARQLEFLITYSDFERIVKRAGGACEVTKIPFSVENETLSRRLPFAPSLDRIDSALPYTASNCRLVACCVNAALSDWGEAVFRTMVMTARLAPGPSDPSAGLKLSARAAKCSRAAAGDDAPSVPAVL
jgi:hypothetical protein